MKRGFTLIEMMIALSISAVILAAVVGLLSSVWVMAKESSDELQFALHVRYVRERIFYNLKDGYGLITAPDKIKDESGTYAQNVSVNSKELAAVLHVDDDSKVEFSSVDDEVIDNALDKSPSQPFADDDEPYRYVYLKVRNGNNEAKPGYVAYYDRIVIPLFGANLSTEKLVEAFQSK